MGVLDIDVDDVPANIINIDANQYEFAPITTVTVYVADRATIVRRIPVELKVLVPIIHSRGNRDDYSRSKSRRVRRVSL